MVKPIIKSFVKISKKNKANQSKILSNKEEKIMILYRFLGVYDYGTCEIISMLCLAVCRYKDYTHAFDKVIS